MKTFISFGLVLATFTQAFAAGSYCGGANCKTAKMSAAGTMVAGGAAVASMLSAKLIEKKHSDVLFQRLAGQKQSLTDSQALQSAQKVTDGDQIRIFYNLSEADNRLHHIKVLEGRIRSEESNVITYRASAMSALSQPYVTTNTTDADGNITGSTTTGGPDHASAASYNMMADQAERNARQLERELDSVHRGTAKIPLYEFDKVVKKTNAQALSNELAQFKAAGKRVVKATRMSAKVAAKVNMATKGGAVLAATAIALGLLTAEEIASGYFARKLDADYQRMKKGW